MLSYLALKSFTFRPEGPCPSCLLLMVKNCHIANGWAGRREDFRLRRQGTEKEGGEGES